MTVWMVKCPKCPAFHRMTAKGNLPYHVRTDTLRGRKRCDGSGQPPIVDPRNERVGPCASCGRECVGERITNTAPEAVYMFSCDDCDQQLGDDFAALIDRAIRGDLP